MSVCVCLCVVMWMGMQLPQRPEASDPPGNGVTGSCEPSHGIGLNHELVGINSDPPQQQHIPLTVELSS